MKKRLGGGVTPQSKKIDLFAPSAPQEVLVESPQVEAKEAKQNTPQKVKKIERRSVNIIKKVLVPIDLHDLDAINSIARRADRNKVKKQHRITANTVIRGLLNLAHDLDIDVSGIDSEESFKKAILKAVNELGSV
jgi:hypothetical protein